MRNHLLMGAAAAALMIPAAAMAQETTSSIRGTVTQDGAPVAGAVVRVTNTGTGATSTTNTNDSGAFNASGLQPGGPYSVEVTSPNGNATVTDIFTVVGQPYTVPVTITSAGGEDIVITASSVAGAGVTSDGPQTVLNAQAISRVASVNRDIRDLARRDPFARIEDTASGGRSISFAGINPRFNRFSIDGVTVSDNFGLNPDANPTRRGPVPIDSISQFSVSVAPYDIRQGNFLGGAVDAVLLSGTNEFHGNGFYSQNTDGLTGERIGCCVDTNFDFKSESYGATLSGPIIKDKLFFMISAERTKQGNPLPNGLVAEGAGTQIPGLTRGLITSVQNLASSVYNYEAGDILTTSNDVDEKIVGKITWNVTDGQRFTLSYINAYDNQQIAGNVNSGFASPSLGLSSNGYGGSELLRAGIAQLNSEWTDVFSTEARFLYKSYERGRPPLGEGGFAQFRVCTDAVTNGNGVAGDTLTSCGQNNPNLALGVENSTQSNVFYTDTYGGSLLARINLNNHNLRLLAEYNEVRIFNLFFQNTLGNYYFDSLDDFQNRRANELVYANALSGNPNDTAADFKYSQWSFGIQDDWRVSDRLNINFGVRGDLWGQRDLPALNPTFTNRYGFSNRNTLKGQFLFQPRVGFNWEPIDDVKLRGGYGIFGGGTPDVYLANSFQNSGVGNNSITVRRTATGFTVNNAFLDPVVGAALLNNVQGNTLPGQLQTLLNQNVAAVNTANVNALGPDYKIPSAHKATLSVDWTPKDFFLGSGWRFGADYYFSRTRDSILFTDARSVQIGTLPDGRPRYNAFPNTNNSTNTDIILYNGNNGRSHVGVVRVDKVFDNGINLNFAYSLQDVKDETPATSSTAGSNYGNGAFLANQAAYGTANDQVSWSFKYGVGLDRAFFGDYRTIFQLFGETQAGRPYSFTMADLGNAQRSAVFGLTGRDDRHLLYVPQSGTDSIVSYDSADTQAALEGVIENSKLKNFRGQIAPRNIARSRAYTRLDLHVEQEIPTFIGKSRFSVFADIENLPNLLNKDWGGFRQVIFPYLEDVVQVQCLTTPVATGTTPTAAQVASAPTQPCVQYRYSQAQAPNEATIESRRSLYFIRLGARFKF
ncbi:TonB-dependent receptor [Sphingomonas sp. Y38-1Y]|uniref:TonB-dependent receptor n=1 Tax=Sphingomonas sp. Y38-1Y TaxID=3078265 RepID=UPI0028EE8818|nr:TonB-dependent receptor [Sphingomonas sp. Y38-1Y]